jgi:hypothetical protein
VSLHRGGDGGANRRNVGTMRQPLPTSPEGEESDVDDSEGPLPTSPEGEESDVDDSEALPFRGGLGGAAIVVARSSLRAITFTKKLRCAPFFRSHPSPLLRLTSISSVAPAFADDRTHRGASVHCVDAKPIYYLLSIHYSLPRKIVLFLIRFVCKSHTKVVSLQCNQSPGG